MDNKNFSIHFILYIYFAILMVGIPFMISLIALLAKIGMTAVVSFYVIVSIGLFFLIAWMFIFYLFNLIFFLKKQYPCNDDNLLINTFCNIIVMIVLTSIGEYMIFLLLFPVLNLLLNLKCILHWMVAKIEKQNPAI